MSKNARSAMPGSSPVRCASAARCSRATAASWLACPKVNSRSMIPSVEGAYTSSNTRGVPPARNTFTSSMLSAPHIMPAMIVVSFPAGLTAPEATRVLGRLRDGADLVGPLKIPGVTSCLGCHKE